MVSRNATEHGKLGNNKEIANKIPLLPPRKRKPTALRIPPGSPYLHLTTTWMFFPFSSFFFAEEFGWDAMTDLSEKSRLGAGQGCDAHLSCRVLAWPGDPTQAAQCPLGALTGRGVCPALAEATESPISSQPAAQETEQRLGASIWKRSPVPRPIAALTRKAPWDAMLFSKPRPQGVVRGNAKK